MTGRPGWRPRPSMSLRLRVVLVTAAAATVMIAVGGALTIRAVRSQFVEAATEMSQNRAEEIAQLAENGTLAQLLPPLDEGETIVQVVRARAVVSHTDNVSAAPLLTPSHQALGTMRTVSVESLPGSGVGPYQVTALGASSPEGPLTVLVAVSMQDVEEVVEEAIGTGTLGLILLVVPLSVLLWLAAGRTLAPVEAIRERASAITTENLAERVPEPPRLDEIGRLARTINAMLGRLDRGAAEQRRFLADAAHEMRSPVASLRAQLETIRSGDLTGNSSGDNDEVAGLLAETLRMQALVDQLLLLARSDAGEIRPARVAVDLDDVVSAAVQAQRSEIRRPEVLVDTREVAPVQVAGDPVLLERVVHNLLENAVKYSSETVQVSLEQDNGDAVLTVDDDGPGIPAESREVVFRRFTRLDHDRARVNGGVGLGLAIVAEVVGAHGGSVAVLAAPTGGARLQVRLPVLDPGPASPRRPRS